ncbi:pimeloyl-ACP methyl ester carboxylesterase [Allocatelliglobosispora scoriae]|uniref:Pimeloyl-ACP methyl ester carboxylesterase n=1 Tax=Allocatelliglobosispora scoriae TaxID=643052 RepID=A0A841BHA5_9ACTN|nr:alpha/beta hydrolase [Allocatelliglobosispora scoriae]MBB5868467.1 pimeloyl-ACP methyl ester carboxylesterase [Allocatelliglobosispora scoriae]
MSLREADHQEPDHRESAPRASTLRIGGLLIPVVWGVIAGLWTPRGPVTAAQALASIGVSLVVGLGAGRLTRSRWSMLLAPVAFAAAVELVRVGYAGPTVDFPHLDPLGILALLVGRGVHGLLALLPLLVGAAYGAGLARRGEPVRGRRLRRYLGRGTVGVLAAATALVAVGVAVPAGTAAIPGGIAELTMVGKLGLMIRGVHPDAPVLLFMAGPPGGSELGAMRLHLSGLEQHFVVATADRRGGGKSYGGLDPTGTLTLDDETASILTLTDYLRKRFGKDKIYLLAQSGSTLPGVFAVQRHPELFHAYVSAAQAVDLTASDRSQYADTLAWARAKGDTALADQLTALGPPPYRDIHSYAPMLLNEGGAFAYPGAIDTGSGQAENFEVPEHSLLDKVHVFSGFLDTFGVLYPRERDIDLRTMVTRLDVPSYFVDGAHDVPGRLALMQPWFDALQAPYKERVIFPDAGHRSMFEKPAEFVALMDRVLTETRG